ncbi:MAG: response regulator, partial [Anaerolineales bacterium]|nr:response regulator [Anaerolineales bacterium]
QDITSERQTQEALSQAERLRSVGVLAGGIAHDFNNLLTGILGQASLVKLRLQQRRPIEKNIDSVIKAAEHAADLTQKLLAYAGKGRFELRVIDINQLLADNRLFLQTLIPARVRFVLQPAAHAAYIEADPGQIQQVVMNLILNAVNACAENGGEVHVQTRPLIVTNTPPPTIAETPLKPGEYHTLIVRDTGKGMDETVLSHIFEPFFTTRENGRGLGLSATLGIIQAHHGGLHVSSTPGVGTTFYIYLPATSAPSAPKPEAHTTATVSATANTILLVDDEAWVRDVVEDGLTSFGFRVFTADNGREGLILHKAHREQLQLVIVDMQMPLMSGAEFIEHIRYEDPNLKIILSSGYSATDIEPSLSNDSHIWFLQKPYSVEQLVWVVNQVLQA